MSSGKYDLGQVTLFRAMELETCYPIAGMMRLALFPNSRWWLFRWEDPLHGHFGCTDSVNISIGILVPR